MLFNSEEFLFRFLPTVLVLFYSVFLVAGARAGMVLLLLASVYFYANWNLSQAALLLALAAMNFGLGQFIIRGASDRARLAFVVSGISINLLVLGYFKYSGFLVRTYDSAFGTSVAYVSPVLPLAISFFTFQKIAYLSDAYRKLVRRTSVTSFFLFVFFFPQLIAGPIVHFREIAPQFEPSRWRRSVTRYWPAGMVFFSIGLAKKVVIADTMANYVVNPYFQFVDGGGALDVLRGWLCALAYTIQLYFDFSGYSDMAIGLGLLLGISLPINFFSPYKSTSVIDFWRRWHITLSRFLQEYLYVPLGGNRKGPARRYINLLVVMLLGGLWHGAEWTFVAWGGLHGLYLCLNHGFRKIRRPSYGTLGRLAAGALTFVCVVVGWVFFRSATFQTAFSVLGSMAGINGLIDGPSMDAQAALMQVGGAEVLFADGLIAAVLVAAACLVCFVAPNLVTMTRYVPGTDATSPESVVPVPSFWLVAWSGVCGGAALWCVLAGQPSSFIYFRF